MTQSHKTWQEWEDDLVLAHDLPDADIAEILGRTVRSVNGRRYVLRNPDRAAASQKAFRGRSPHSHYEAQKKWRRANPKGRNAQRKANYDKSRVGADRAWQPWTFEEMEMAEAHAIPDAELAKQIQRSVAAIQIQRSKMKKEAKTE